MTFGSPGFVLFTLGVLVASAAFDRRRRWIVLLVASGAFYLAVSSIALLAVLTAVTVITWVAALGIERHAGARRANCFFWGGVLVPLGVLLGMKYVGFMVENVS